MPSTFVNRTAANGRGTAQDLFDQLAPGRPARHRNWPRVGAGVALAILCGAIFVLLYSTAGSRHPYLAVAKPVAVGQMITASDLATARVTSDSTISPIPATEIGVVIGRRASVALVPGTLITPLELASGPVLGDGQASVGLDLKPGQAPEGLVPGQSVVVVDTSSQPALGGGTSGTSGSPLVLVSQATVLSTMEPTSNSASDDTEVTLAVPADIAPEVVAASSAGDIAIAGLGSSSGS